MAERAKRPLISEKSSPKGSPASPFTPRQGQFLAFIRDYTRLHRQAPTETETAAYFHVTPPSVHGMIVTLEKRGLLERTPREVRSLRLRVPPESLPTLGEYLGEEYLEEESDALPATSWLPRISFEERYPHLAFWVTEQGRIELGYEPNTGTWARAVEDGGMAWGGGQSNATIEDWLEAMEAGGEAYREEWGI